MKYVEKWIAVVFVSVGLVGCATNNQRLYDYGDYSSTLYSLSKNQNEETLAEHKSALEQIITSSKEHTRKVPPGIYAELGYIYQKENNKKEAVKLYKLESDLYPESQYLMARLIKQIEVNDASDHE